MPALVAVPALFTVIVYAPFTPRVKLAGLVLATRRLKSFTGVTSAKVLLPVLPGGSPPPLTETLLVTLGTAPPPTATWKVMAFGLLAPAAMTAPLVQTTRVPPTMLSPASGVLAVQVQPVPAGTTAIVRPAGSVSVTV